MFITPCMLLWDLLCGWIKQIKKMFHRGKTFLFRVQLGPLKGRRQTQSWGSMAGLGLCTWHTKATGGIYCTQVHQTLHCLFHFSEKFYVDLFCINQRRVVHLYLTPKLTFAKAALHDISFFFHFGKKCKHFAIKCAVKYLLQSHSNESAEALF